MNDQTQRALPKKGEVVSYKGRNYTVVFAGTTKFGEKAKLAFTDGSKEFWVDLALISAPAATTPPRSNTRRNWRPCGYPGCNPNYCDECDGEGYSSGR
mgnify:CR=1 FL=1